MNCRLPEWLFPEAGLVTVCTYFVDTILYMPVPHTEHLPLMAGRPFFMVTFTGSLISRLVLHFTQYPSSAIFTSFVVNWIECII